MTPINGRIQREGEAAHLMARQLLDLITDLSVPAARMPDLGCRSARETSFLVVAGRIHATRKSRSCG
jgi:hypothetical protein